MPHVCALYRYPIKGFTPESVQALTVLAEGRIAGDRALAFRFADSGLPPTAWSKKYGFAVLVNTPGLAQLEGTFDPATQRVRIAHGRRVLAEARLDANGRTELAAAVASYVQTLPDNPLSNHPERLPLELVGDGATPRYQDSERGEITLHSRESLAAIGDALGERQLNEVRFRSNIAIEGVSAWSEQDWVGRRIRVGAVEFDVTRPKVRCLATHANPRTGERDQPIMQTLVRAFRQKEPTFAVALITSGPGGEILVGDELRVI